MFTVQTQVEDLKTKLGLKGQRTEPGDMIERMNQAKLGKLKVETKEASEKETKKNIKSKKVAKKVVKKKLSVKTKKNVRTKQVDKQRKYSKRK